MIKNFVLHHVAPATRARVFTGTPPPFNSKRSPYTAPASMNSANRDATEGFETLMAKPATVVKQAQRSRVREIAGSQPMERAWEQLWKEGTTPWDAQGVTPVIAQMLKENKIRDGRALVPGCGSGYDVVAMGSPSRRVTGLDISQTALQRAEVLAEKSPNGAFVEFQNADFFAFAPPVKFDLVFDYTFFCALEPSLRPQWAEKMADLLAWDGELITLMFPLVDYEGGPPYSVSLAAYENVLTPLGFQLTNCDADIPSLEARRGAEKLARWQRAISKV